MNCTNIRSPHHYALRLRLSSQLAVALAAEQPLRESEGPLQKILDQGDETQVVSEAWIRDARRPRGRHGLPLLGRLPDAVGIPKLLPVTPAVAVAVLPAELRGPLQAGGLKVNAELVALAMALRVHVSRGHRLPGARYSVAVWDQAYVTRTAFATPRKQPADKSQQPQAQGPSVRRGEAQHRQQRPARRASGAVGHRGPARLGLGFG
eukprot:CAMPEP_0177209084 /NCGR_PEP_ID=MMETSP0367-20130122/30831_1 /TAXON_ID=447022 ORGANISM="Scrippsiella hangoei-like, Strain SHHI-4" /NCGR_SAMPLE_ID=MMETSP0367 /ASSEMBLY_ACC=CAM_ASM_000362 /LENGTH=206 /DNA_ID=CAMNT_0018658101 /DNA_START=113 /DNA_END=729 /DNA_ORIENTATION=-